MRVNRAGTNRPLAYALTPMLAGGYRAECHAPGCGWWADRLDRDAAVTLLRDHVTRAHPDTPWRTKRAELRDP